MLSQPLTVIWQRFETVYEKYLVVFFLCKFSAAIEMMKLTSLCALSHLMYTAVGHLGFWNYLGKGFVALCHRNKTQPGSKRMRYTQGQCPSWFLLSTVVPCEIPPYQLPLQEECDRQVGVQPCCSENWATAVPGVHNHSVGKCLEPGVLQDSSAPCASTLCLWCSELHRQW